METVHTRSALSDEVAAAIIREGDVERLVNIAHPMAEELKGGELGLIIVRRAQDLKVGRDSREEALGPDEARRASNRPERARYIDEVFVGSFPRMIRPRAGIREGVERRVERNQPDNLSPCLVVEFLKGDLADDLMT